MSKYLVYATELVSYTIAVEAESEAQARDLANEEIDAWGVEPSSNLPVDDIERQIQAVHLG